ncbi:MAG: hypothetical protein F6J98_24905, partial [Moorea sp. SIO4G2]|nr:hypothetical protein [Moorena sp. SIO4G2]
GELPTLHQLHQLLLWWAVPTNGIGNPINRSGELPTLHQLHQLLLFPVPCSLFPVPCSLFPVPFFYQSYVHISNTNAIVWIY